MYDIERRANQDLFYYTSTNHDFFDTLDHYTPKNDRYINIVKSFLPDQWELKYQTGVWRHVVPPIESNKGEGFKIHLSTIPKDAEALLEHIAPILIEHELAFKFLPDYWMLDLCNSQAFFKAASGKFVTIYPPSTAVFKDVIEKLYSATLGLKGPYILSDRVYKDSKVVFYRFGSFRPFQEMNANGEQTAMLSLGPGKRVEDERRAFYFLPDGVAEPFGKVIDYPEQVNLKDRYQYVRTIAAGNKGGVYLFRDVVGDTEVIVKEARPFINSAAHSPSDAIDFLHNEYQVLQLLADTGLTPKPIDFFKDWDHYFLAMEQAPGVNLAVMRSLDTFSPFLQGDCADQDIRNYGSRIIHIADLLLEGLKVIHSKGVFIMDLAPQNVLYDQDSDTIQFIDFEAAHSPGGESRSSAFTPGFVSPNRKNGGAPRPVDDYFGAAEIIRNLIYPVHPLFLLNSDARKPLFDAYCREKRLPSAISELIEGIAQGFEPGKNAVQKANTAILKRPLPEPTYYTTDDQDLKRTVDGVSKHIMAHVKLDGSLPMFPPDYRVFRTNMLSLAYGAAGTVYFLKLAMGQLPQDIESQFLNHCRSVNPGTLPPGLFIGASGIAWVLDSMGFREDALHMMEHAYQSPILDKSADHFYGAAGWGLAALYFYSVTGDENHLAQAAKAADLILNLLETTEKGLLCYPNVTGDVYTGLAYGGTGIAYFFLKLHQASNQPKHLETAVALIEEEIRRGEDQGEWIKWPRSRNNPVHMPYLGVGSAGIGVVLLRFYDQLKEPRFLNIINKCCHYLKDKYSVNPCLLSGMAGVGYFFLERYLHANESRYLLEARNYAGRVNLFKIEKNEGVCFPHEELQKTSHDLGYGSAGTGLFLALLKDRKKMMIYDF